MPATTAARKSTSPRKRARGTSQTARLRKVACPCGTILYASRMQLARALPTCGLCGEPCMPQDYETACAVLPDHVLAEHPAMLEYARKVEDVAAGQTGPAMSLRRKGTLDDFYTRNGTPEEQAAAHVGFPLTGYEPWTREQLLELASRLETARIVAADPITEF